MPYTIDTHATIRDLEAAGIELPKAEAIVSAIGRSDSRLATKDDLAVLQSSFEAALSAMANKLLLAIVAVAGLTLTLAKLID